jgi:hypothetical protein
VFKHFADRHVYRQGQKSGWREPFTPDFKGFDNMFGYLHTQEKKYSASLLRLPPA